MHTIPNKQYFRVAELQQPKGLPSGAPYPYRTAKETHELIFSWFSWLVVLLMGTTTMTETAKIDSGHTPANRLTGTYSPGL